MSAPGNPGDGLTEDHGGKQGDNHGDKPVRHREVLSFSRRDGRFSRRYAAAWEPEMAGWFVRPERGDRDASIAENWTLDAAAEFGREAPLIVEIGSGTGDALLAHAAEFPQINHLGVEVYRPGVARTVLRAKRRGLPNVRVLEGDAAALLAHGLPPGSVAEIHVWFPDPWPKARHHKRRLVSPLFLDRAVAALRPGGVVRLATDWTDYAVSMAESARECAGLVPWGTPDQETVFDTEDETESTEPSADPNAEATQLVTRGRLYGQVGRYRYRPVTRFEKKGTDLRRPIADLAFRTR